MLIEEVYRSEVDTCIASMDPSKTILNGSHEHASIIIERMFANANKSVAILTRKFDARIFAATRLINEASHFFGDTERTSRILIEDVDETSLERNQFIKEFYRYQNLEIREVSESLKNIVDVNFSIMDDSGYRLEVDKHQAVAVACFGDSSFTKGLSNTFDAIWEFSKEVEISI